MTDDVYAPLAEFYDVLAIGFVEALRGPVARALVGADASVGAVLDIGAGTGLSTLLVADALPEAPILAIEPSPTLRAILTSRIAARADLRGRVTVVPNRFAECAAQLPDQVGGAVLLGSLGHLQDAERRELWKFLARALGRGCPAVLQLLAPERPEVHPFKRYASEQIGRRTYEGWSAAEPAGAHSMQWTMTYRILENGHLLDERTVRQDYVTLGENDLVSEAAAAGLECESVGAGLVRIVRGTRESRSALCCSGS